MLIQKNNGIKTLKPQKLILYKKIFELHDKWIKYKLLRFCMEQQSKLDFKYMFKTREKLIDTGKGICIGNVIHS